MRYEKLGGALQNTPAQERRQSHRVTPIFRTAKLVCENFEIPCIVRDASVSGVMIQMFGSPPETDFRLLELSNGEQFAVERIWFEGSHAGLKFHGDIALDRLLALSHGNFPKRQLRVSTRASCNIFLGDEIHPAKFENVSQQGAKISCSAHLAINQLLRVETGIIPPLYAKVRWRKEPDYGLVFERLLDFEELGSLATASPPPGNPKTDSMVA